MKAFDTTGCQLLRSLVALWIAISHKMNELLNHHADEAVHDLKAVPTPTCNFHQESV